MIPVLLDAGPLAGDVMPGFHALHAEGCDDPRVTWAAPPHQALAGDYPDPLAGDALVGGVVEVQLPPGAWTVAALLGREPLALSDLTVAWGLRASDGGVVEVPAPASYDALRASPAFSVGARARFVPGESAWDRVIAPAAPWVSLDVTVGAEPLRLTPFGRPLQALVITPRDAAAAALADVQAARRAWYHDHVDPAPVGLPPVTWGPGALAPLGAVPGAATPTLRLAPGERDGVVVWTTQDAPGRVEIRAPADLLVETYEVGWIDTAQTVRPRRPRPELLIPTTGPLTGGQGAPVAVALLIRARDDAKPGARRVTARVIQGGARVDVPLRVDVLPVALPPRPFPAGLIAQVDQLATALDGYDSPAVRARLDADLALLRRLDTDLLSLRFLVTRSGWTSASVDAVTLAPWAWQRWAALGGRLLVWPDPKVSTRAAAYRSDDPDPLPDALAEQLDGLLPLVRTSPVEVVVPFWEEEGGWHNADAGARARAFVPQLRDIAPGLRFAATAAHPLDHAVADVFDVMMLTTWPPLTREAVDAVRAKGASAWAYNLPSGRTGPWMAWAVGAEALLQWHLHPGVAAPLHDSHELPVAWYAAPGPDGQVWHTALLERWARGLADLRWFVALEQRVLAHGADPAHAEAVARGEALLAVARDAVDGALVNGPAWDGELLAPGAPERLMQAIRDAVLALPPPG